MIFPIMVALVAACNFAPSPSMPTGSSAAKASLTAIVPHPKTRTSTASGAQTTTGRTFNGLQCTTPSNPQPNFTHEVIPLGLLSHTAPPGTVVSGMLKPHAYFFVRREKEPEKHVWVGYPRSVPVSAPVESWLRSVHVYINTSNTGLGSETGSGEPPIEYMLFFEESCEVWYKLDHLGPLSERITALGPFQMGHNELRQTLHIDAGELVAYWSGVNPGGNIDLGVYNTTVNATFPNPDRHSDGYHDSYRYEDCPFDYFPEILRSKYYGLLAEENTFQPVNTTKCRRSVEQESPGTISGKWFLPNKYESVLSIGTSLLGVVRVSFAAHPKTGANFEITVRPSHPTYKEPSRITESHCYWSADHSMYVALRLLTSMTLEVRYGSGTCAVRTSTHLLLVER